MEAPVSEEDLFWRTLAESSDPPASKDIIITALRGHLADTSAPVSTATVPRKVMKFNPNFSRNPKPNPVTDEYGPDEESPAIALQAFLKC